MGAPFVRVVTGMINAIARPTLLQMDTPRLFRTLLESRSPGIPSRPRIMTAMECGPAQRLYLDRPGASSHCHTTVSRDMDKSE
jgi:hypothetical protein